MARLRIATYNVHKCQGMDGRVRPQRIAEVLAHVNADVVALQEVLSFGENGDLDQARFLAQELGYSYALGENRKHRGAAYGNVMLSRLPVRDSRNFDVTVPGRERRGCLRTDIELGGDVLHVFNVHLGTSYRERRHQGRLLLNQELLGGVLPGRRVVLGDFNEWTKGLASRLLSAELQSADLRLHTSKSRTYPGFLPFLHLDHIYYDRSMKLDSIRVHRTPLALVASDHLPLIAEFL